MEFRWEDIKWGVSDTVENPYEGRGVIYVRDGLKFEIWTHDNHLTYTVLLRYADLTPIWRLAIDVPKLEAMCVAIEWFKNNT